MLSNLKQKVLERFYFSFPLFILSPFAIFAEHL